MDLDADNKARIAFVLTLALVALGALGWYFWTASRYATYQIGTHDPVSGLIADAPVEFHGVDVGKVRSVELVNPRTVRILLDIRRDAPVTTATMATITSRGLATRGFTGYVYVLLDDVGTDTRPLAAPVGGGYPVIPTTPSRVVNLDMAIAQVNDNVQLLTAKIDSVLDAKTVASLKQSVASLDRFTKTLAENDARLRSLIDKTEKASQQLPPLLDTSRDTMKALQTQVLPEAYKALSNVDDLASTLTGAATKISRDPSVLVRGATPPPPGPGGEKK